jgi:hypothetical protein
VSGGEDVVDYVYWFISPARPILCYLFWCFKRAFFFASSFNPRVTYPRISHAPGGTRRSSSRQSPGGGCCPGGRSGYQMRHFPGGGMWPGGMSGGPGRYAGGGGGGGGPGSPTTTPKEHPLIRMRKSNPSINPIHDRLLIALSMKSPFAHCLTPVGRLHHIISSHNRSAFVRLWRTTA